MFDANTLSQLASLKNQIGGDKPLLTGVVQGTAGRFGFVVTDHDDRHFLPPDEMKRVLPGDRIEFSVTEVDGKSQAAVETLVHSDFGRFVGKVVVTGKTKLLAPDYTGLNRWIALTNKAAEAAVEGQWVRGCLKRHPIADGRALADITELLGDDQTPFLEHTVTKARFNLADDFPDAVKKAAEAIDYEGILAAQSDYEDATHVPLMTIDSASTQDMDDAFAIADEGDHWALTVAIADPGLFIDAGSILDREALARTSSRYLPGETVHMLPKTLSVEQCSLRPETIRPAMLMRVSVHKASAAASVPAFSFGRVRSRAKLAYDEVSAFLAGNTGADVPAELHTQIQQLAELTNLLTDYRQQHCMVMPDRPDYRLRLNDRGQVETIEEDTKGQANQMVEEVMLLTNHLTAKHLAAHEQGLFMCHDGFRPDQLETVKALLDSTLCQHEPVAVEHLSEFTDALPLLQRAGEYRELPLQQMLPKFFRRTELGPDPRPHWGLGFPVYTTVTSPIRKYLDLHLHRQLKALWRRQTEVPRLNAEDLATLQRNQSTLRAPANFTEQWLKTVFLKPKEGTVFDGVIQHVTANGFAVQLDGLGTTGFVNIKGWRDKTATFDPVRQIHQTSKGEFRLNQPLRVMLQSVDLDRRNIQLDIHTAT